MLSHPVVGYHLSYFTLDPIQGCPYGCNYCLWRPYHITGGKPSKPIVEPNVLYDDLDSLLTGFDFQNFYIDGYKPRIPIAIGNLTDMCATPGNRKYLLKALEIHYDKFPQIPLLLQTKAIISQDLINQIDSIGVQVILAVSAVFFPEWNKYEPGTPNSVDRIKNFEKIRKTNNIIGIHYWRPVTNIDINNLDDIREKVRLLKQSGSEASVLAGLMLGEKISDMLRTDSSNALHNYYLKYNQFAQNQMLEPEIMDAVFDIANSEGYPIYHRQTSCAISYVLKQVDYYSSYRKYYRARCERSSCPEEQRERCNSFRNSYYHPSKDLLYRIAKWLDIDDSKVLYDKENEVILVEGILSQDKQNFLSHSTGFLVKATTVISNSEWSGTHVRSDTRK